MAVAAERVLAPPDPPPAANTPLFLLGTPRPARLSAQPFCTALPSRSLAPPAHPRLQSGHHQVRMDSGCKQGLWSWCLVRIHLLHFLAQWPSSSLRTHSPQVITAEPYAPSKEQSPSTDQGGRGEAPWRWMDQGGVRPNASLSRDCSPAWRRFWGSHVIFGNVSCHLN